jgi:NAD(P)H-hydrate epimerase
MNMLADVLMPPKLPPRSPAGHKGDYGRILVIAGSRGMSGAAVLCGSAALRGGAGLVRVAVPRDILPIVAAGNACYMTAPLSQDDDGRLCLTATAELRRLADENDVIALGPGLGRSADLDRLVADLLKHGRRPMVVDADALNALSQDVAILKEHAGPVVLTPHPGEFARLLNTTIAAVQNDRRDLAARFAAEHGVIVVLKGHGTIVTDGRHCYTNTTGNPAMATGGTGDVLTGLIAALLGQGLEPLAAAQLGVYAHGLAGDLARDLLGIGLIASDLLEFLPQALRRC